MIELRPRAGRRIPFPWQRMTLLWYCLAIIPCSSEALRAQTGWQQKEFILGTFFDPPLRESAGHLAGDSARFALVREAGFNLLTGTNEEGGIDRTFRGMQHGLSVAGRNGLKYLVTDGRYFEAFRIAFRPELVREVVRDYRALPSMLRETMYGYFLCDEPRFERVQMDRTVQWKNHFAQADPEKLTYVNLVASYAADANWGGFSRGNADLRLDDVERREYEEYVQQYVGRMAPAVVSFDHYPFFRDGRFRSDYFYNLRIIRAAAMERPMWAMPMTCGHLSYVDPSSEHIAFMYFCPLAYGAKGLIVFTFWPPSVAGYRTAPVDGQGRKSRTFDTVRALNLFVSKAIAPVIMNSRHLGVYHAAVFPSNQVFMNSPTPSVVDSMVRAEDPAVLIGGFRGANADHLLIVNKRLTPIRNVKVWVRGSGLNIALSSRWRSVAVNGAVSYRRVAVSTETATGYALFLVPELAGGEGVLARVER